MPASSTADAWPRRSSGLAGVLGLAAAGALFGVVVFANLSHPLLWHDEALTVVFGERVLAYGYPKVHGPEGAHYPMHHDLSVGTREPLDAYIGSPWAQYYLAALGVAWAEGTPDFYGKTLRLRLPFAIAGCIGLALLLLTALPTLPTRARRRGFALLYLLLAGYSVSLVLHLREARYYALVVLFGSCVVYLSARHRLRGASGPCAIGLAAGLFLLFNTFYLAFGGLFAGLVLHAGLSALRRRGQPGEARRRLVRDLLPLAAAGAAIVPLLFFYDTFAVAGAFAEAYTGPKNAYANKLGWLLASLLRYEFLAPALALRLAAWLGSRGVEPGQMAPPLRERLELSGLLATLFACYAVVVSAAPFFYERYTILLGPLLTLTMLLDAFSLWELRASGPGIASARRLAGALAVLGALAFAGSLGVRTPEFRGRLLEVRHAYRGPLDFVVPYLAERYPDPAALTIATNYEDPSLRYYLGSRVIVGWFSPYLEEDLQQEPDVIIPRPGGRNQQALAWLARRGSFEPKRLPVENVHANNVPSLAPWNHARWVHRFETPHADPAAGNALLILERRPAARTQGPPRTAPDSAGAPPPRTPPPPG